MDYASDNLAIHLAITGFCGVCGYRVNGWALALVTAAIVWWLVREYMP